MKVLIVDDHILFRQGLVSLLKSQADFKVVGEAGSVRQAIQKAHELRPDLVLMDFSLPDGSGLEATQAILAENPTCKIVFLTVYETDEKLFAAIRMGAKGYMLKNVPISDLLASLRGLEHGEPAISRSMTGKIIEEFSHTEKPYAAKSAVLDRLSQREVQILRELAGGASNKEIADRLFITENTVKHHIHSILAKLELKGRHEAANFARQQGLKPAHPDPGPDSPAD